MSGSKTYAVAGLLALFAVGVGFNDWTQFGYVKADTIRYVGGMLFGAGGLASLRHAVSKGG